MSRPPIPFADLAAHALAHADRLLPDWLGGGGRDGTEYRAARRADGGPGDSLSVSLRTGAWHHRAAGEGGGDLVSLCAYLRHGGDQAAAAREIDQTLGLGLLDGAAPTPRPLPPAPPKPVDEWVEAPPDGSEPPDRHPTRGEPSERYVYRDAAGFAIGCVMRFDTTQPNGTRLKTFAQCALYRRNDNPDTAPVWRWARLPRPSPLYGLDILAEQPDAPVLIVEGERACHAGRTLGLPAIVTTWPGGARASRSVDVRPLAGRRVTIWPDADEPGHLAAGILADLLAPIASDVLLVVPPDGVEIGWDLADAVAEGWDKSAVLRHIATCRAARDAARVATPTEATSDDEPPVDYVPPDMLDGASLPGSGGEPPGDPVPLPERTDPEPDPRPDAAWPFRCLGYDRGTYYYLPDRTQQIVALESSQHGSRQLLTLAPLAWWESAFPAKSGADWTSAADGLMRACEAATLYDPAARRGRGCWIDGERVVYHAGDRLLVDGVDTRIRDWTSDEGAIYERAPRLDIGSDIPSPNEEAARLLALCQSLGWRHDLSAYLLAGWCVVAPICGVLRWRPHIWVSGPSGSGKSWVVDNIVRQVVGTSALVVQSATTEAGIRQTLGTDARPVIFDEAESEDMHGQARMRTVLELARQASTDQGGIIAKGSAGGVAKSYLIRSCFAFSSIGMAASQKADLSRITALELRRRDPGEFSRTNALVAETVADPTYCAQLRARSVLHAAQIRANAETFARAVAAHLGDRRTGDQVGALLAGAVALTTRRHLTLDEAGDWVRARDWSALVTTTTDADESRALAVLLDAHVRIDGEDGPAVTRTVGELLTTAWGRTVPGNTDEAAVLVRHGIRVEDDAVVVASSSTHQWLRRVYADTPWAGKWGGQLARVEGAQVLAAVKIGSAAHRGVRLPRHALNS